MKRAAQLATAAALAGTVIGASGTGYASTSADSARVIDRALACMVLPARVGAVRASASSRMGSAGANTLLVTGNAGGEGLAAVVTDKAVPFGWPGPSGPGLSIDAGLCHPAKTRVPLTADGLGGGPAPLGANATCLTAARVVVHVRVTMVSKPRWTTEAGYQVAHGKPLSAEIAVRSRKEKPLVYSALRGPSARLYSAAGC